MIKLKVLRWGGNPGGPNAITTVLFRETVGRRVRGREVTKKAEGEVSDCWMDGWKLQARKWGQPPDTGKGKKTDSPLSHQKALPIVTRFSPLRLNLDF